MAANTAPIYSKVGDIQWCSLTAANTAYDGTGTVGTVWVSDATNGGRLEYIKARAAGTNTGTVARFFINNGSTNATPANNTLFLEFALGGTTASIIAATPDYLIGAPTFPIVLPPGYKIIVVIATAVAAGWVFTGVGGKY